MKNIITFSLLAFTLVQLTACATRSDVENLQSQVDSLDTSVKQASATAAHAQNMAASAGAKAEAAEAAANRAAELSQDTNNRLDRRFRGSMMK